MIDWGAVATSLVVNGVLAALSWLRQRFLARWDTRHPRLRPASFVILSLFWFGGNAALIAWAGLEPWTAWIIAGLAFLGISLLELGRLWLVGIYGVDPRIRKGIDYEASLRLAKNSLDFLGTGADKLSSTDAFEACLRRCHRAHRPVRFLLAHPDQAKSQLVKAAQLARDDREEYRRRVSESLRRIANLSKGAGINVEVRLYDQLQPFRLMFVDDQLCLFSYNVYGQGEDFDHPQVHVVKAGDRRRDVETFYYPLRQYFDQLWDASSRWNPTEWTGTDA